MLSPLAPRSVLTVYCRTPISSPFQMHKMGRIFLHITNSECLETRPKIFFGFNTYRHKCRKSAFLSAARVRQNPSEGHVGVVAFRRSSDPAWAISATQHAAAAAAKRTTAPIPGALASSQQSGIHPTAGGPTALLISTMANKIVSSRPPHRAVDSCTKRDRAFQVGQTKTAARSRGRIGGSGEHREMAWDHHSSSGSLLIRGDVDLEKSPFGQLDDPIGAMKISIVVRNDDDSLAASFKFRQQFRIEDTLEIRILIRRPLIE
jgi:hypothetical protein